MEIVRKRVINTQYWTENMKGTDHLKELDMDGWITLICTSIFMGETMFGLLVKSILIRLH
jgi:hypothetical protein